MNPEVTFRVTRLRQHLAGVGFATIIVAVTLGILRPAVVRPALQLAVFASLAPAIGAMLFLLIHRCTGGAWGDSLRPFLASSARLAPWIWLGIVPLLFVDATRVANSWAYDCTAAGAIRAGVYGLVLLGVSLGLTRSSAPWVGPAGLIALLFSLHLLSDDWLVTLEPGWHSTAFSLTWLTGQAVAGLSVAVLGALTVGISPRTPGGSSSRPLGIDWGNLLLTATLCWCYVTFAQFLIIWGSNLPRETSWFLRRMNDGWASVPAVLTLLNFLVPLALLLSRQHKCSPKGLGFAAGGLFLGQLIFIAWLILPAFPAGHTFVGLVAAFLLAIGSLAGGASFALGRAVRAVSAP